MKKYVVLTPSISNIGGAEIYCRNKKKFLEEEGWTVEIFFYKQGKILINDLRTSENNNSPILEYHPLFYSKARREKLINKINKESYGFDTIVIESHTQTLALWGEMIANDISGKHIIYLLTESFKDLSKSEFSFFNYKHKRMELAGINIRSLSLLFKSYKKLNDSEKYFLRASCTNVVEDIENEMINEIIKADINIGCITRLEKKFVSDLVDDVITFANRNKEKKIQFIIFGSSENKDLEKRIYDKLKTEKNLKLIITGFLFPIPKKIFQLADVFVGVAGSSRISALEGVPTISLDVIDGKPIGVLGYNTENSLYRDTESQISTFQLLEDIIEDKQKYLKNIDNIAIVDYRMEYQNHLKFIESSFQAKDYYNFSRYRLNLREKIRKLIFRIFGDKNYKRITQFNIKIKKILFYGSRGS